MNYIGRQKAAELLGVTRQTISNYVERGYFDVRKVGGQLYLSEESVLDFKDKHIEDIKASLDTIEEYKSSMKKAAEKMRSAISAINSDIQTYRVYGENISKLIISMAESFDLGISLRQKDMLCDYLRTGTTSGIARAYCLSRSRVDQIIHKTINGLQKSIEEVKCCQEEALRLQRKRCYEQHKRIVALEAYTSKLEKIVANENVEPKKGYTTLNEEKVQLINSDTLVAGFTARTRNCLHTVGVKTIGDLLSHDKKFYLSIRCFGRKCLTEIEDFINALPYELTLGMDIQEFIKEDA